MTRIATATIVHTLNADLLPSVERPARYLGGEVNSVHKDLNEVDVRFCLAFPDLYDLGMANVGLLILYSQLNRQKGVWCERTYAPGLDMEAQMRAREIPLWSWESKTPLRDFDCLGFTLQYEMCYTTVLNMLDLAGIPLHSEDRDTSHPIVIAGGPCVFNPEPLADFIDAFVIGDGEEVVLEIVQALRDTRGLPRDQKLQALDAIPGVYVPLLYSIAPLIDGTRVVLSRGLLEQNDRDDLLRWLPRLDNAQLREAVRKRLVLDLNATPFVTDYVVPWVQQVHDRVSLEIFRGCMRGCRFCQAGMITRPVRERSLETIAAIVEDTRKKTGYDELTLMSLSSCDYSRSFELVQQTVTQLAPHNISVSMPSTRVDGFNMEIADTIAGYKKSNWTFAPEAGTQRLRDAIAKPITQEELLNKTEQVFAGGWGHVKLYFMIGLPTETEDDVIGIAELANEVLRRGRKANSKARVNLGVSTHVPKPHTPFQWAEQIGIEETLARQRLLRNRLRDKSAVKFGHHDAETSYLEGVFSRGDRRLGRALEEAHRRGCRLDGWTEHLKFDVWREVFEAVEIDADQYLRQIPVGQPLPWDHIDCLVTKEFHRREWQKTMDNVPIEDCRLDAHCYICGPINHFPKGKSNPCVHMIHSTQQGRKIDLRKLEEHRAERSKDNAASSDDTSRAALRPNTQSVQRIRFRFARTGTLRYLSHLEMQSAIERALRRAEIPMAFSQGFSPRPKLSFATALPVGMASEAEWADVELCANLPTGEFVGRINATLPEGLEVLGAFEVAPDSPSLTSQLVGSVYRLSNLPLTGAELQRVIESFWQTQTVVTRKTPKGERPVVVQHLTQRIRAVDGTLDCELADGSEGKGRPQELAAALFGERNGIEILKVGAVFRNHV